MYMLRGTDTASYIDLKKEKTFSRGAKMEYTQQKHVDLFQLESDYIS